MAQNLEDLRKDLYKIFTHAAANSTYPGYVQGNPEQTKAAALSVTAAANAANAIVNVEREIADRNATSGTGGMKMPGK